MKRILGILGIFAGWELAARTVNSPMFSTFTTTLLSLWKIRTVLYPHITTSLLHVLLGFSIAVVTGTLLGILIHESRFIELMMMPVIDAMRPIAALTMFPLLITILGLGIKSKAFVIFWTAWPAIVLNTIEGLRNVDQSIIEAANLDGCTRIQLLTHIKAPLAASMYITGLRIGLSGGWISVVSAEMLGSSAGLGYAILHYSQTFRFPEMYAIILVIATIGLLMNMGLALLQNSVGLENTSPFIRFNDRASSFGFDHNLFTKKE